MGLTSPLRKALPPKVGGEPGFTGIDAHGHKWQNGRQVAIGKEEPTGQQPVAKEQSAAPQQSSPEQKAAEYAKQATEKLGDQAMPRIEELKQKYANDPAKLNALNAVAEKIEPPKSPADKKESELIEKYGDKAKAKIEEAKRKYMDYKTVLGRIEVELEKEGSSPIVPEAKPTASVKKTPNQSIHESLDILKKIPQFQDGLIDIHRAFSQVNHDREKTGNAPLTLKEFHKELQGMWDRGEIEMQQVNERPRPDKKGREAENARLQAMLDHGIKQGDNNFNMILKLKGPGLKTPLRKALPPKVRKSAQDWTRGQGERGGIFWQNIRTGEKVYQQENPGGAERTPQEQPGEKPQGQEQQPKQTPEQKAEDYARQLKDKFGDQAMERIDAMKQKYAGDEAKLNALNLVGQSLEKINKWSTGDESMLDMIDAEEAMDAANVAYDQLPGGKADDIPAKMEEKPKKPTEGKALRDISDDDLVNRINSAAGGIKSWNGRQMDAGEKLNHKVFISDVYDAIKSSVGNPTIDEFKDRLWELQQAHKISLGRNDMPQYAHSQDAVKASVIRREGLGHHDTAVQHVINSKPWEAKPDVKPAVRTPVESALADIQDLYENANGDADVHSKVKDAIERMDENLMGKQIKEVAKKFGINDLAGSRQDVLDRISAKVSGRREMFARTEKQKPIPSPLRKKEGKPFVDKEDDTKIKKRVSQDVDLTEVRNLGDMVVNFEAQKNPDGSYSVTQDNVDPAAKVKWGDLEELIRGMWKKGYAFGDVFPENMTYSNGKLQILDLDSFGHIEESGFNNVDDLVATIKKTSRTFTTEPEKPIPSPLRKKKDKPEISPERAAEKPQHSQQDVAMREVARSVDKLLADPEKGRGGLISIPNVRAAVEKRTGISREAFDEAVLQMWRDGKIQLEQRSHSDNTEEDRRLHGKREDALMTDKGSELKHPTYQFWIEKKKP